MINYEPHSTPQIPNSQGLQVRRLNFSDRPQTDDRAIDAEFDIAPGDYIYVLGTKRLLSGFYKGATKLRALLRIFPDVGRMNAGAISIHFHTDDGGSGLGGTLLPSGEVVPRISNESDVEKIFDLNLVHSVARLVAGKIDANLLRQSTISTSLNPQVAAPRPPVS